MSVVTIPRQFGAGGVTLGKKLSGLRGYTLIADLKDRIAFLQIHYQLEHDQAARVVSAEEKRRRNLYRKFKKSDYDQPEHDHLTLNMSKIPLERAAAIVSNMVTRRQHQMVRQPRQHPAAGRHQRPNLTAGTNFRTSF